MNELKKKALPCEICAYYGGIKGICNRDNEFPITSNECLDDFGAHYCPMHKNKYTNEFTGGYKMIEDKAKTTKERQKVYFISDFHFSHTGAIHFHPERLEKAGMDFHEFCENTSIEMAKYDEWLIEQWNNKIRREDTVYFLGDFCLGNRERTQYILSRLKGKKYLIRGNHDKSCKGLENYFEWVGDIKEAKFTNNQFKFIDPNETFSVEMCHFPMLTWNRRPHGSCMVHGHTHGSINNFNTSSKELRIDVGYDSDFAQQWDGFVELEDLYAYFCGIRDEAGCKTFEEYAEWKMKNDGFRM